MSYLAGIFSSAYSGGVTPILTLKPVLYDFEITDAEKTKIYFKSSAPITGLTTTGFVVTGKTISSITINGANLTGHYFTVSAAFTFWDNNTIRLSGGNGIVYDFTMEYIVNNIEEPAYTREMYASATTQGAGTGVDEANAWSYTNAAQNAQAGDIVWMKADVNGSTTTMTLPRNGTTNAPIKFVGYKTTPGDITSMYYTYGQGALVPSEMPMINPGTQGSGKGINLSGRSFIIIKNIQIQNVQDGIHSTTAITDIVVDNCLLKNIGDGAASYSGFGIGSPYVSTTTNRFRIKNCLLMDAKAEAIANYGNYGLIDNCKVYSDDDTQTYSGTDYYIYVEGNYNITRNSYAKRGAVSHGGHAFGGKAHNPTTYNLFENNQAIDFKNEMLYAAYSGFQYNVFKHNYAKGLTANSTGTNGEGCIMIRDGASNNIFENNYCELGSYGIEFAVTGESGTNSGSGNIIRNNIFKGRFRYWLAVLGGSTSSVFSGNKIQNNTIYDMQQLYRFFGAGSGNEMTGNIFHTGTSTTTAWEQGGSIGMTYSLNNTWALNFSFPTGTAQTSIDPQFIDFQDFEPLAEIYIAKISGSNYDYNKGERAPQTTVGAVKNQKELVQTGENIPAKPTINRIVENPNKATITNIT